MRRLALVISSLLLLVAPAGCGKTTDETALVVTVYTDFAVPDAMNLIRITVTADGRKTDYPFQLSSAKEPGKATVPVQLAFIPGGPKNQLISVSATGFIGDTKLVWQDASLPFIPGQAHELVLYLAKACENKSCDDPAYTCSAGRCDRLISVDTGKLPRHTTGGVAPPPDADPPDSGREAGAWDAAKDVSAEAAEVKRTDVPPLGPDAESPDTRDDVPVATSDTGGMAGTGGTSGEDADTGAAGQTGSSATGGAAGSGGVSQTSNPGSGGIISTAGASGTGNIDAGAVDAPAPGGSIDGGGASGGNTALGGSVGGMVITGGAGVAGSSTGGTTGGSTDAGVTTTGGATDAGGSSGTGGATGPSSGPCDIYAAASTPCAAAYSMIRVLSKSYIGPLFQVRAGSSSNNNTMSGGTTKDIMPGLDGFVDSATVDAACGAEGYCTVSVLYDHSGNANHLMRAPKGNSAGGPRAAEDDYESIATKGLVKAGGHTVYSLFMNRFEGYRTQVGVKGKNMPVDSEPQGTYELADGTRKGSACCWDFGNVITQPTQYAFSDTLCFATTYWGLGVSPGPWFGIDFSGGVWTGGSKDGDPGWGAFNGTHTVNSNNPSMNLTPFALGFIAVNASTYSIRAADVLMDQNLTTAYAGNIPTDLVVKHQGGIVLGVAPDNGNNSSGTFYEGAIVAGYPTENTELDVMKNIQAVGYSK